MPLPPIDPPLLNSSNPWATTLQDLQALFDCPHTGAVSTRTSLLHGFEHDDSIHQYTFFDATDHSLQRNQNKPSHSSSIAHGGSLNTLGYSPLPLHQYLSMIARVVSDSTLLPPTRRRTKPFIISVTGSAAAVCECYRMIQAAQTNMSNPLCMEINLSCPNIPGKPPPAYERASLRGYLEGLGREREGEGGRRVAVGIKTPPFTYLDQFQTLVDALIAASGDDDDDDDKNNVNGESRSRRSPIGFITATNTLGSSLVLSETGNGFAPALHSASGHGIGGMAGAPLHPLALGNVKTLREMLDAHAELRDIDVIGVGGVGDAAGYRRMRAVGAKAVAVATALGREGVGVFERILEGGET